MINIEKIYRSDLDHHINMDVMSSAQCIQNSENVKRLAIMTKFILDKKRLITNQYFEVFEDTHSRIQTSDINLALEKYNSL